MTHVSQTYCTWQVGRLSLTLAARFIRQRHHGERCHWGLRQGEATKVGKIPSGFPGVGGPNY